MGFCDIQDIQEERSSIPTTEQKAAVSAAVYPLQLRKYGSTEPLNYFYLNKWVHTRYCIWLLEKKNKDYAMKLLIWLFK